MEPFPQQEVYTDDEYPIDECNYTQQAQLQLPAKPPAHEIKTLASVVKILENLKVEVSNLYNKYETKYQQAQQASTTQTKRPTVGKKQKQPRILNASYFKDSFRRFFLMENMNEASLESNLKVFFQEQGRLKETINPQDLAITPQEFLIYKKAVDLSLTGYYITEKDIPLLIRRMYKDPAECSTVGKDGTKISFDASNFVGASRQEILDTLESLRLIYYDRTDASSSFCVSKRLPGLLEQIPILKPLNLEATDMANYLTYDSFIKLIDLIRDKNEIYRTIVDTDRAKQIVEKLGLPDIDGYYKPEYISIIIKSLNLKKEDFFKDVNRVITGLSVIPPQSTLLNE